MFNLLFVLTLTITSVHSLQSMDLLVPEKKEKSSNWPFRKKYHSDETLEASTTAQEKQSKHFKKTSSLPSVHEGKVLKPSEHGLITAVRDKDINRVKFYLSNPYFNPNVQNTWKNTPLHYAAMFKTTEIINLFFNDPRIDASIRNTDNRTPRELVAGKTDDDYTLRRIIFARASLNMVVNYYVTTIKPDYISGKIEQNTIQKYVTEILEKAKADQQKQQNDEALPGAAHYPDYATHDFVEKMLLFRLTLIDN